MKPNNEEIVAESNYFAETLMCFLRKRFCKSVGDEIKCPKDKRVWAKPYRPRRPEYKNITDYLRRFLFQNITVLPIVGEGLCALQKINLSEYLRYILCTIAIESQIVGDGALDVPQMNLPDYLCYLLYDNPSETIV